MPFFVVDWLMGLFGLAKWVPYLCYQRPAARRPSTAARRPSTAAAARRPRQKRPQPANRQPAQPPSASVSYSWTAGGRPSRGTAAVPSWPAGGNGRQNRGSSAFSSSSRSEESGGGGAGIDVSGDNPEGRSAFSASCFPMRRSTRVGWQKSISRDKEADQASSST